MKKLAPLGASVFVLLETLQILTNYIVVINALSTAVQASYTDSPFR